MGAIASMADRMALDQTAALAFLIPVLPLCLWVAYSDLAHMKIRNLAVLGLIASFCVIAPFVLPWPTVGWQLVQGLAVLTIGFILNLGGALGAGDAKFLAAASPFVPAADAATVFYLLASVLLAAFVTHRGARRLTALRQLAPGWKSWENQKFPMGLALGPTLAIYLMICALA